MPPVPFSEFLIQLRVFSCSRCNNVVFAQHSVDLFSFAARFYQLRRANSEHQVCLNNGLRMRRPSWIHQQIWHARRKTLRVTTHFIQLCDSLWHLICFSPSQLPILISHFCFYFHATPCVPSLKRFFSLLMMIRKQFQNIQGRRLYGTFCWKLFSANINENQRQRIPTLCQIWIPTEKGMCWLQN